MYLDHNNEYENLEGSLLKHLLKKPITEDKPKGLEVSNDQIVTISVNRLGNSAYCFFQYIAGVDRGIAILDIFIAIRSYWSNRSLNLQLDPGWSLNSYRIGVIVQAVDDYGAL